MELNPSGGPLAARYGHTAGYDQTTNRMIVFGGNQLDDLWILTNANGNGGVPTWLAPAVSGAILLAGLAMPPSMMRRPTRC